MKTIIRFGARFVWSGGQRYRVAEGSVNIESQTLTVYKEDYSSLGSTMHTLRFDEIESVEY